VERGTPRLLTTNQERDQRHHARSPRAPIATRTPAETAPSTGQAGARRIDQRPEPDEQQGGPTATARKRRWSQMLVPANLESEVPPRADHETTAQGEQLAA